MTTPARGARGAGVEPRRALPLTELVGRGVATHDGRPLGRLRDVGVALDGRFPRLTSVHVRGRHTSATLRAPVVVADVGLLSPDPPARGREELLLVRDVLDRQLFDARGRRLTRVADVLLELEGTALRLAAIETGAAGVLRRLGLRRLAARLRPSIVGWEQLQLLSGPGHELQLRSPEAGIHLLDDEQLAELVRRAPSRRGAEVLAHVHPTRRDRIRRLLAQARPRRRSTDPLSARRHAPS